MILCLNENICLCIKNANLFTLLSCALCFKETFVFLSRSFLLLMNVSRAKHSGGGSEMDMAPSDMAALRRLMSYMRSVRSQVQHAI